jgi:hypothetical protein
MRKRAMGKLVAILVMGLALAGCFDSGSGDGEGGGNLKSTLNNPPMLAGVPATGVTAGEAYVFQPTASDPDGQAIVFSIRNLPRWASFDTGTGRLAGVPSIDDLGNYPGIVIAASDGITTSELDEFTITVKAPAGHQISNTTPTISGSPATMAYVGFE